MKHINELLKKEVDQKQKAKDQLLAEFRLKLLESAKCMTTNNDRLKEMIAEAFHMQSVLAGTNSIG